MEALTLHVRDNSVLAFRHAGDIWFPRASIAAILRRTERDVNLTWSWQQHQFSIRQHHLDVADHAGRKVDIDVYNLQGLMLFAILSGSEPDTMRWVTQVLFSWTPVWAADPQDFFLWIDDLAVT